MNETERPVMNRFAIIIIVLIVRRFHRGETPAIYKFKWERGQLIPFDRARSPAAFTDLFSAGKQSRRQFPQFLSHTATTIIQTDGINENNKLT